jgi:hypothetical protein
MELRLFAVAAFELAALDSTLQRDEGARQNVRNGCKPILTRGLVLELAKSFGVRRIRIAGLSV